MKKTDITSLLNIVAQLRNPNGGCPWDLAQTFQTMIPNMLEESYEVAEALHNNDKVALREELGDLLLQVVFLSQLAEEEGSFNFNDVVNDIQDKLIFRHPHVFGDSLAQNSAEALQNWEAMKAQEKKRKQQTSILDDLPFALPALTRAEKLQKRCAKVGFDWDNPEDVLAKVDEELNEVKAELAQFNKNDARIAEELGDLLFATVNLCRHYQHNAEETLRNANLKFERRFRLLEQAVQKQGKNVKDLTLSELDSIWEQIKMAQ